MLNFFGGMPRSDTDTEYTAALQNEMARRQGRPMAAVPPVAQDYGTVMSNEFNRRYAGLSPQGQTMYATQHSAAAPVPTTAPAIAAASPNMAGMSPVFSGIGGSLKSGMQRFGLGPDSWYATQPPVPNVPMAGPSFSARRYDTMR